MKRICVFCGSRAGLNPVYSQAALDLADELHKQGLGLVYGGASVGLMGALASRMLELNAEVIGVIPEALIQKEFAHTGLSELIVVKTMHQRKFKMFELSDAFIALPGGFGTFDEFCEILTWAQIGYHTKPMGFLNVNSYFDLLIQQFDHGVREGFIRKEHRDFLIVSQSPAELMKEIQKRQEVKPVLETNNGR